MSTVVIEPSDAGTVVVTSSLTGFVIEVGSTQPYVQEVLVPGAQGAKGDTGDQGPQGPQGDEGVVISATAPANTEVLWADTSEPGDAVLPIGGSAGQVLTKVSGSDYDAGWTHQAYSWSYPSGYYVSMPPVATTGATLVSKRTFVTPFFFPKPTAIDRISIRITSGGAAGSVVRFGIYENDDGFPGALIADLGTIDATTVATAVELTIDETVSGWVWIAARLNNLSSPTVIRYNGGTQFINVNTSVPAVNLSGFLSAPETPDDELPDPYPSGANSAPSNTGPVMRVRVA